MMAMAKMRQSLVPVILLAIVALSSSNVLPIMSINQIESEALGLNGPQNDNIFSNRFENKNILNDIFYKISIGTSLHDRFPKVRKLPEEKSPDQDNNRSDDDFDIINKENSYNGEGFRKEQWHNYPRQLDRLHKYLYERYNAEKRNPDPDNPNAVEDYNDETPPKSNNRVNNITNEYFMYNNDDAQNVYDSIVANSNPLLILKIQLACLSSKLDKRDLIKAFQEYESNHETREENAELLTNELNPSLQMDPVKVKREDVSGSQNSEVVDPGNEKKTVKKRLFSLWSRLQSLNHKGHELQHRRHLHAYYGLPNSDGSGVLTAETRASMMRPPGSPLRWG